MNITKFGAFVNILPGRDGLLHISKIGRGKRIDRVEDVLSLDDQVDVIVEDIDPQGKVALALVGDKVGGSDGAGDNGEAGEAPVRAPRESAAAAEAPAGDRPDRVSFDDYFDAEAAQTYGDLGPARPASERDGEREGAPRGDRDRGGRDRRGNGRGGDRRRR